MIPKSVKLLLAVLLIVGCAARAPMPEAPIFEPFDLNYKLQSGKYVAKVDNYMIILDASQSMSEPYKYKDHTHFTFAKEIIRRMNQTLPELNVKGALRTFGHGVCLPKEKTLLINTLDAHNRERLDVGLEKVACDGGTSPIGEAIGAVGEDLKKSSGNTALIIVSDGKDMDLSPVDDAAVLKKQFGERLCIYTVLVGDAPEGQHLMDKIAEAGECGFSVNAENIATGQGMASFVEMVFLAEAKDTDGDGVSDHMDRCPGTPRGLSVDASGCPKDSDRDGVYDDIDRCPNTPKGVRVDRSGCPMDSDKDGVFDNADRCPDTPSGVSVNSDGCPVDTDGDGVYDYLDQCPGTPSGAAVDEKGCWGCNTVEFDFDKWEITSQHQDALDGILKCLQASPGLNFELQGHADSIGTSEYNITLSEKRAQAVKQYLIEKGVSEERLMVKGYGMSQPVDSNETKEGRARNRRVQLKPMD